MSNHVKLTPGSWIGLALIAFCSVAMFSASMAVFHPSPSRNRDSLVRVNDPCDCDRDSNRDIGMVIGGSRLRMSVQESAPPVNQTARDEVKHSATEADEPVKEQSPCATGNCNRPVINWSQYTQANYQPSQSVQPMVIPTQVSQYTNWPGRSEASSLAARMGARLVESVIPGTNSIAAFATLQNGMVWNSSRAAVTQTYSGANCFLAVLGDMQQGTSNPNANATLPGSPIPAANPVNPQPATPSIPAPSTKQGRHQLVLFLDSDPASQLVASWFNSDPQLKRLKENCATEIYSSTGPSSIMYRARYSNLIQPKDFPAILFMQPDGGHIYAVGKPMMPRAPEALVSDMRTGLKLAQSVQQAALVMASGTSGAIKTQGYNWDSMITDNMQLVKSQEFPTDCVDQDGDGECDTEQREPWYPGQRIVDVLGGDKKPGIEAMLWTSGPEIAQVILSLLVVGLCVAIAIKLFKK